VDRQLRGRCARQGDPGCSQFFLSLEDDLLRNHASPERMAAVIERASAGRNGPPPPLGPLVEDAQQRIEQRDYKARKQVLDFDDVLNLQRDIVYGFRDEILGAEDSRSMVRELIGSTVATMLEGQEADPPGLLWDDGDSPSGEQGEPAAAGPAPTAVAARACAAYDRRVAGLPPELVEVMERSVVLDAIDSGWREHLSDMDELRDGVYLRAQGQKDPLMEFKNSGYELFESLMDGIKRTALRNLFRSAGALAAAVARHRDRGRAAS
jgi:preprotein translocase subunit SecA